MRKKLICISLMIMTIFSLSIFMTGCQKAAEKVTEKAIEQSTGGQAKVDLNKDKVTVTTNEGTTTVGGTNEWPGKMPADVPKFAAGKINSVTESSTADHGLSYYIGVEGAVLADLEKYKGQLESNGWKIESTTTMSDGYMVSASKGEQNIVYSFSKSNDTYSGGFIYTQKK
jgi:hypothetical protein